MTVTIYRDDSANAIFVQDNNGAQFLNNLQAVVDDPTVDTTLHIRDKSRDNYLFYAIEHGDIVDQQGSAYGSTATLSANALNALFSASGSPTGDAPVITSSTSVTLTEGDTMNYELIATDGVGYEWSDLPSGVVTVDGNVRKLVGGSGLSVGSYVMTAKAINYFGVDEQEITLTVVSAPWSNTKSIKFSNQDYIGANASILDGALGRSANGAGSSDAWTVALWYKASSDNQGQSIFYFGDNDVTNSGFLEIRQTNAAGQKRLRLRYGSNNNYIQLNTTPGSLTAGTWQHIAVTYDGGTTGSSSSDLSSYYGRFSIYIDGSAQTTNNTHRNFGYTGSIEPDNLRVGRFSSGAHMRQAYVDELAVWNSDQTANIGDIYNSGTPHDLTSLSSAPQHYWRMGDGDSFPNIRDNVGNADFVMYNMTAADIVSDVP